MSDLIEQAEKLSSNPDDELSETHKSLQLQASTL